MLVSKWLDVVVIGSFLLVSHRPLALPINFLLLDEGQSEERIRL